MERIKNYDREQGLGYYYGSEGLVSTVSDFYSFAAMLMNSGVCPTTNRRVLSETAVREMLSNQVIGGGEITMRTADRAGDDFELVGIRRSGMGLGVSVAVRPSSGEPPSPGSGSSSLGAGVTTAVWENFLGVVPPTPSSSGPRKTGNSWCSSSRK